MALGTYIEPWQPLVTKRGNQIAENGDAEENEEDLVGLSSKNTVSILVLEDIDAPNKEERGSEIDSEGDGDVTDNIQPAANPTSNATVFGRRQHESLVVNTYGQAIRRIALRKAVNVANLPPAVG